MTRKIEYSKPLRVTTYDKRTVSLKFEVVMMSPGLRNMWNSVRFNDNMPTVKLGFVTSQMLEHLTQWCIYNYNQNLTESCGDEEADSHEQDVERLRQQEEDLLVKNERCNNFTLWNERFLRNISGIGMQGLIEMMIASDCLAIQPLFDLTCQYLASRLKGLSADKIRRMLYIRNDFSTNELEQVRRECAWIRAP